MAFVSRLPRDARLDALVDRVWWTGPEGEAGVQGEWLLPTGKAQIILSPNGSVFAGPRVVASRHQRRIGRPMVGVSLTAGALPAVLGVGGRESRDLTVPLDCVWPTGQLAERLAEMTCETALDLVETLLCQRVEAFDVDVEVVRAAHASVEGQPAALSMRKLGVDRRTFVPRFRKVVGCAPKQYERICRFNRSIRAIRHTEAAGLSEIAATLGYADQAHLTREVGHFAGFSPSRLHRDGGAMVNHVAIDKIFKT